tara:strand:+ start:4255 stop:4470 length:216 start_codon:yes stop_codon:yes gene_type:complete
MNDLATEAAKAIFFASSISALFDGELDLFFLSFFFSFLVFSDLFSLVPASLISSFSGVYICNLIVINGSKF